MYEIRQWLFFFQSPTRKGLGPVITELGLCRCQLITNCHGCFRLLYLSSCCPPCPLLLPNQGYDRNTACRRKCEPLISINWRTPILPPTQPFFKFKFHVIRYQDSIMGSSTSVSRFTTSAWVVYCYVNPSNPKTCQFLYSFRIDLGTVESTVHCIWESKELETYTFWPFGGVDS